MHRSHSSEIMLSNEMDEAKRKIVFCSFSADGSSLENGGRAGLRKVQDQPNLQGNWKVRKRLRKSVI